MKKKLLLILLPIILATSCGGKQVKTTSHGRKAGEIYLVGEEDGIPVMSREGNNSTFKTYLMMSPFGYVTTPGFPVKGSVSDLFLENTITFEAAPGTNLPDATEVKSTVSGTTFRGWAYYEEKDGVVWPTYFDKVPDVEGLQLKVIFDGTDAGGNTGGGGSGGGGGGSGGGTTQTGYGLLKNGTTAIIGEYKGKNFENYEEYLVSGESFAVGDTFALYDPSTLATWTVEINPYSFSQHPELYVTRGATEYTVIQAFTGDFYIQLMYQQDRLYIELSA